HGEGARLAARAAAADAQQAGLGRGAQPCRGPVVIRVHQFGPVPHSMRKLAIVLALAFAAPAFAGSSFSTDVSDLWWNPDESGWGVNVIQQGNYVFATFFVYDASGRAHGYVASAMVAPSAAASGATFQGDLFEARGPYFAVPFN